MRKNSMKRFFATMGIVVLSSSTVFSMPVFADPIPEETQEPEGEGGAPEGNEESDPQDSGKSVPAESEPSSEAAPVYTENADGSTSVTYDETITGIPTEDKKDEVVTEKTAEQEQLKSDIEAQNGTYGYTIGVEQITLEVIPHEEAAPNEEAAKQLAQEKDGTVETTTSTASGTAVETIDYTEDKSVVEKEKQDFANKVKAGVEKEQDQDKTGEEEEKDSALGSSEEKDKNSTSVNSDSKQDVSTNEIPTPPAENTVREIKEIKEEVVSGVTAEQVDEEGYHINKNEDGSFSVVITGGLEEISINLPWFEQQVQMMPGSEVSTKYSIVNESGDKYEVVSHQLLTDGGPYRYVLESKYKEELGEQVRTFQGKNSRGDIFNYVAYVPNDLLKRGDGKTVDKTSMQFAKDKYRRL